MVTDDGTDTFKGQTLNEVIDSVVLWHGTSLPSGGSNDIPQGGYFFLEDQDGTNVRGLYEQTNATKSTPTWILRAPMAQPITNFSDVDVDSDALTFAYLKDNQGYHLYDGITDTTVIPPMHKFYNPLAVAAGLPIGLIVSDDFTRYTTEAETDEHYPSENETYVDVDTAGNTIDYDADVGTTNNYKLNFDLGFTLESTWVLRFTLAETWSQTSTANPMHLFVGLADTTDSLGTAQDGIFFRLKVGGNDADYNILDCNSEAPKDKAVDATHSTAPSSGSTRYFQLTRTSDTGYKLEIFSDSGYTTELGSDATGTISASTVTNLRYFKVGINTVEANPHTLNGTIDKWELKNGVTSW